MKNKKLAIISVSILFVVGIIFFYASPYLALASIKSSVEKKDIQKVSTYIDFPVLKENMKTSIIQEIMKTSTSTGKKRESEEVVAGEIYKLFVAPLLDVYLSPTGIAVLFGINEAGTKNNQQKNNELQKFVPKISPESIKSGEGLSYGYDNINSFTLKIADKKTNESVSFVFKRKGLFSWKLVDFKFPINLR